MDNEKTPEIIVTFEKDKILEALGVKKYMAEHGTPFASWVVMADDVALILSDRDYKGKDAIRLYNHLMHKAGKRK